MTAFLYYLDCTFDFGQLVERTKGTEIVLVCLITTFRHLHYYAIIVGAKGDC